VFYKRFSFIFPKKLPDRLTGSILDGLFFCNREFSDRLLGFNAYLTHTPGHTIGSMSLIVDNEIAIVGDTMFGVFNWSAFPPYAQDADLMLKSWKKLLETNCNEFLPSHGTANSRDLVQKCYNKKLKSCK